MARIRTGYSFRTAVGHIPDVNKRLKAIGWKAAPITDRESTFGFRRWRDQSKKNDMKPVFGTELGVVPALGEKKPTPNFCTFLALDHLRPLNELVFQATQNPGRDPSLTIGQAMGAEGVIKIFGERATLESLQAISEASLSYLALSPSMPKKIIKVAAQLGMKFIAVSDNYYPEEADLEFYRVTLGKRSNTQTYAMHILSDDEWRKAIDPVVSPELAAQALKNRDEALERCKAELKSAELLKPERPATLLELCERGAKRLGVDLTDPIYAERLERELSLIEEKQFEDYFYIIEDIVNWAKERMIVGPARGSSCGSLVCYLLNITTIDPIPYGLIFERFIDINRKDLPDIDIDFSDQRRDLVFDYMESKYGRDRVARLGTVGLFKPRSALKQAATILRVPGWRVEKVLDSVIERSSGDSRAMFALEDTLNSTEAGSEMLKSFPNILIAGKMEGHPNNPSQHAAGMLVTNEPIIEYVAVDDRTHAAMLDKKDAEILNLLKIDALGLTQLSIFERTLQLMGKPDVSGWLEKLPMEDQKAFDVLNDHKFAGIFQFMGGALQSLVKQVKITRIDDIISITALARPGPMATGGAMSWVKRRAGIEKISSLHPLLTELTKETYGVIVYQEQVMQIARQIGKMSWADTSELRKAMSKSLGKEFFDQYWLKFRSGALENGIEEETAKAIWDQINTFGSWAFNLSHAVAYGTVSYYCCWLKAHYPMEFSAATLDAENDPMKQIRLLRELYKEGIDYVPFDIDHSTGKWEVAEKEGKKILVGPLTSIKGIGTAAMSEIISCRDMGEPIRPALAKRLNNAKTEIDSIFPVRDAIKSKYPCLADIGIVTPPTPIEKIQCGIDGDVVLIGIARKIAPKDENEHVNVQKRGYELKGPTQALNLFVADDSDEIFCKVGRFDFERIGKEIVERGKPGKAIYAIKGPVPRGFRMVSVKQVKFLGFTDEEVIDKFEVH